MIFVLSSLRYVTAYAKTLPIQSLLLHLSLLSHLHLVCTVLCVNLSVLFFPLISVMKVLLGIQSSIYLAVQILSEI